MIERRCPECEFRDLDHVDAGSAQLFREHQDAARAELVALLDSLSASGA